MGINLACQLLSNSVALVTETLVIVNLLDNTSLYTGHICKFFNNLFDIFNTCSTNKFNVYKNSLVNNVESLNYLKNDVHILNDIKYCDNKYIDQLPCLRVWRLNVNSLLLLLEDDIIVNNLHSMYLNILIRIFFFENEK